MSPKYGQIPPPPPAGAAFITFEDVAGLLRISMSRFKRIRSTIATFPKPYLLADGVPRMRRSDVEAWVLTLPQGWSTLGGRRFTKKPAAEAEAAEKETTRA